MSKQNIFLHPSFLQEEYGNFIHTNYESLLAKLKQDSATAFRFIYLCTYMRYDDYYIIWNKSKVKVDDLIEIFNVSKNTMTKIKKALLNNELIFIDKESYVFANKKYCYRGDLSNVQGYKQHFTRIFNQSIQELYNKTQNNKEHKSLGKLILILPYINIYHNVLCTNIREKDFDKIQLLSPTQTDEILNNVSRNSSRSMKWLLDLEVGGEPVILVIIHKYLKMYAVNPRVYYGGNNLTHLQHLISYVEKRGDTEL